MNQNIVKTFIFMVGLIAIFTSCSLLRPEKSTAPIPSGTESPNLNTPVPSDTNASEVDNVNPYKPVIILPYGNTMEKGYVMGGSKDGKWIGISDFKIPESNIGKEVDIDLINGSENYMLYSAGQLVGEGKGSKATYIISEGSGSEMLFVNVAPFPQVKEDLVIGINGNWDPLPSIPKKATYDLNKYLAPVIDATGFDKSAEIKDVTLVDIDGDGNDESIINIISSPSGNSPEGVEKKSLIVVEKKINDEVKYIKLHESYFKIRCYAYDLNGDGKMEIILEGSAHEEHFVNAYEIDGENSRSAISFYEGV